MMMPRIAAALLNTPLMVHPGKAAAIMVGLGGRLMGRDVTVNGAEAINHVAFAGGRPSMGVIGDKLGRAFERRAQKPYDMVGNVAVIAIEGSLVHKGAFVESDSGETSYQGIQTQVQAAMRDGSVKGVAFEVDSFGGQVAGVFETAYMIHALSKAKPTIAILTDNAFSAGYLMAAAARQIVIPEEGGAGSIGVIAMHADMSGALEQAGVAITVQTAGVHKADGNPYEPLPDSVASKIRAELEAVRKTFAGRVAAYRGKRLSFEAAMATEARSFTGDAAVKAGLADATGHAAETFRAFVTALNRA